MKEYALNLANDVDISFDILFSLFENIKGGAI